MKKFLIIGLILLIGIRSIALATTTATTTFENPLNVDDIWELINSIIDFIYNISIPLLAIVVLWAGFTMITSGGKPENFKKGQNILLYAAIGFGIILLSKGVAYIVSEILNAGDVQNESPISECTIGEQLCSSRSNCNTGFGMSYCENQGGVGTWKEGECCQEGCNNSGTGCSGGLII